MAKPKTSGRGWMLRKEGRHFIAAPFALFEGPNDFNRSARARMWLADWAAGEFGLDAEEQERLHKGADVRGMCIGADIGAEFDPESR